jgi:iron complex outermembrane receptor protein
MPLEDIERIEVVRGPGATLWGSNAVNGVINIITKHARDTQGSLVSARGGSNGDAAVETRYGAHAAGEALDYRVSGKYSLWNRTPGLQDPGPTAYDGRDRLQSGFRADWSATPVNSLTFSGDIYRSSLEESWMAPMLVPPYSWQAGSEMKATGGNLRTRWLHRFGGGSESSAQIYYDHMDRLFPVIDLRQRTFGLDVQYHTALGQRNDVVAGGEYRRTGLGTRGTVAASLIPDHSVFSVFSGFIQDEIMLFPDRPSVHLRWQPHSRHVIWAAVSRASRIPSYYEESSRVGVLASPGPAGIPLEGIVFGSQGLSTRGTSSTCAATCRCRAASNSITLFITPARWRARLCPGTRGSTPAWGGMPTKGWSSAWPGRT